MNNCYYINKLHSDEKDKRRVLCTSIANVKKYILEVYPTYIIPDLLKRSTFIRRDEDIYITNKYGFPMLEIGLIHFVV